MRTRKMVPNRLVVLRAEMRKISDMTHMTDDEKRRMALLEATLREVRSIATAAEQDPSSVPPEAAYEGLLLKRWKKTLRQINQLVP